MNPGREFAGTRHNVGGDAVALLGRRHDLSLKRERGLAAQVGEIVHGDRRLAVALPETYMNDSGVAVGPLAVRYVARDAGRLIIVHDELDLDPGVVRVKVGGGTAGHNGLRSIGHHLGSLAFIRVRIGIGKPRGRSDGARFVLDRPGRAERADLDIATEFAADAVWMIFERGVDAAMTAVNST
jgi:PTH1 family peptidyl-tRNA hydrolase